MRNSAFEGTDELICSEQANSDEQDRLLTLSINEKCGRKERGIRLDSTDAVS